MNTPNALRVLADLSASQWGLVTTAQAVARGLSRLDLARLTDAEHLVRLAHGVYRDSGAPGDEYEELRVAWLATEPKRLAETRLGDRGEGVVVAGTSAAWLHDIGELRADRHELTSPSRRQSQRAEIRYRQRTLDPADVTIVNGLPVTTRERTIADLVDTRVDFSLIGNALGDAARASRLDLDRLTELLAPLAARNGLRRGDGGALLDRLAEIAGLDLKSLARQIVSSGELGALVTAEFLRQLSRSGGAAKLQAKQLEPVFETMRILSKEWALSGDSLAVSKNLTTELAQIARPAIPSTRELVNGKSGQDD